MQSRFDLPDHDLSNSEPLDSRRLRAFWLIAQTGSIATAATAMHLTPSAMSHSLKSLEQDLGCELFERRGHRAILTGPGARLVPRVELILKEMSLMRRELTLLNQWDRGLLRLGVPASACEYFMPDVLLEFRECFPNCELDVVSVDAKPALEMVRGGSLDLAIGLADGKPSEVNTRLLFQDELLIVVSPRHSWARLKQVTAKELNGHKLIVYNRDSLSTAMVQKHLEMIGVQQAGFVTLSSMEAIKEMARVGLFPGVVASWVALHDIEVGTLKGLRMAGPPLCRQWAALWSEHRPLTVMAQTLIGLCQDVTALAPYGS